LAADGYLWFIEVFIRRKLGAISSANLCASPALGYLNPTKSFKITFGIGAWNVPKVLADALTVSIPSKSYHRHSDNRPELLHVI